MDLPDLLAALSDPAAYPQPGPVEVRQTHISAVFLVGDTVYKVRKPVRLGFVDFSTLAKRKADCDAEVRLNRRLAPGVYRGVVPITVVDGRAKVDGPGEPVEWAVEMVRLPDDATMRHRLDRDELTAADVERVARRIADFHRTAERGEHVSRFGRFDVVAGNARENFAQTAGHVGSIVPRSIHDRCRELTERALSELKELIEARAARGVPCDTHGDLHLDHVYLFPNRPPPDDLVVIDCVEFADRFRFADPVADVAFLVMDLAFCGRRDLAKVCAEAYFAASRRLAVSPSPPASGGEGRGEGGYGSRDQQAGSPGPETPLIPNPSPPEAGGEGDQADEGRRLLPFYVAYRSIVRAKVEGMQSLEPEVPADDRDLHRYAARAHWQLALGTLEEPTRRSALVLVGGLPGTGKSTLARGLASAAGFAVVRSDEIRKQLAGVPVAETGVGIYTPEWTEATYAECLRRTWAGLDDSRRVLVDATFAANAHRALFLETGRERRVPAVFLVCRADPALVRERLRNRRGDASDADERVYDELAARWEAVDPRYQWQTVEMDTTDAGRALDQALGVLRKMGVA